MKINYKIYTYTVAIISCFSGFNLPHKESYKVFPSTADLCFQSKGVDDAFCRREFSHLFHKHHILLLLIIFPSPSTHPTQTQRPSVVALGTARGTFSVSIFKNAFLSLTVWNLSVFSDNLLFLCVPFLWEGNISPQKKVMILALHQKWREVLL